MELKLINRSRNGYTVGLLIVPYGIETQNAEDVSNVARLLIVPYGIETSDYTMQCYITTLLIVPYGIETRNAYREKNTNESFNRTLWN